jgi:hypothetical protein
MNRERRSLFLVVLTLVTYGLSIFFDHGSFILPFPIFDFILLIVSLQFAFWNWRDILSFRKWYFYVYFIAILTKILTNQLLWSFFLDDQDLTIFNNELWIDTFRLAFFVEILLIFFCWSYVEKLKYKYIAFLVLLGLQIAGLFEETYYLSYIEMPLFAVYVFSQKPKNSLTYLLILHAILDLLSLTMVTLVH